MKKMNHGFCCGFYCLLIMMLISCNQQTTTVTKEAIIDMNLKRGAVVLCSPGDQQLGTIAFSTSCSAETQKDFDLAIALLHSFEYDEAEKVFAKIIDQEPGCAMAYWGAAMCNYHQVWPSPPTTAELEKGYKAIVIAASINQKSKKETDYINAMAAFYKEWKTVDHRTRTLRFAKAIQELYAAYSADKEAAVFYALSLVGSADPADKTYSNQRKAGEILNALYPNEPNHPGIVHYIIHSYDYPELAALGLPAARKYASIAPASAHAQHMPSHIFIRLGLWNESIQSNLVSTSSAKCYAETAGIKGHWDEELHGMDYLVYAYLQKAQNDLAKQQWDYLKSIEQVYPANFKVAYAYAAIPSRYVLENKRWNEAATLQIHPVDFAWQNFPWQKSIHHFTRLLGAVHLKDIRSAKTELKTINSLHNELLQQKDMYKANQVMIQIKTGEAWILYAEGKTNDAIQLMKEAAAMEDKTEKSPVTPGEVLPAKELLADMFLLLHKPDDALAAYEEVLLRRPNRFNTVYGAAVASEQLKQTEKAIQYYRQLTTIANAKDSKRPELETARTFLMSDQSN
ncbi:MAG: tetratricopeptide repeat protein [Chitinophagaceae bacterium]|nr:tetratricopeptide repeat protein [Chitinophagaceae bacterium]